MAEHAAVASVISALGKNRVGQMNEVMSKGPPNEKTALPIKLHHFNISGQRFIISSKLIKKYPDTKFDSASSLAENWIEDQHMFYFDRDPALFNAVLNVFRYDVLNVPTGYDKTLVMKELEFWWVPIDKLNMAQDEEDERLEAEFEWLENRIPPPRSDAKTWIKMRYKIWCFMTDPLSPYTPFRKLSFVCCLFTALLTLIYMILFSLSTSVHYRDPVTTDTPGHNNHSYSEDMEGATAALGCTSMAKLDCYLQSTPKPWIEISKTVLMAIFITETVVRLLLCPGFAYFKSVITWMDIVAGICAIFVFAMVEVENSYPDMEQKKARSTHYVVILMDAIQVLRVFKIFQYANVLDGLMIMMLTIKASLKELLLLVMYLLLAMFLFSTLIFFAEIEADTGTGIPDAMLGFWWSIITMTTVGYGDFYPTTTGGYFIGVMCAITGIILTALPVAVIGSNFNMYWEHNKKRKAALMALLELQEKKKLNNSQLF